MITPLKNWEKATIGVLSGSKKQQSSVKRQESTTNTKSPTSLTTAKAADRLIEALREG